MRGKQPDILNARIEIAIAVQQREFLLGAARRDQRAVG
jgi:hypothetical protein